MAEDHNSLWWDLGHLHDIVDERHTVDDQPGLSGCSGGVAESAIAVKCASTGGT